MRSASELIEELNAVDESTSIEAKAGSEIGKSIIETVCAFANEPGLGGGYLVLGVERIRQQEQLFDVGYEATGLTVPEKVQADLASQCASMLSKPVRPEIRVERVGNASVVVAHIPEAASTDKPVYIMSKGLPRGAFRRIGPADQACTEDDLIVLYEGHRAETYDTTIITDGTLADIDASAISEYRALRANVNVNAEELTWSDGDLLRAFGCAREEGGVVRPTVAGVLLFGTPMALRRCFPMVRVDYIRVAGREWVKDPDRRFDTVEIRAPLISTIRRATNAILDDLPKSFSLPSGEIQSTDEPILPLRVIREAVVNAVMHRSYRIQGAPTQIIRYANRLEIRNPGHSLKAEDHLGQPGSETRNPKIAAVLHEVNIAETKGSGIRVMRELMQRNNLLPPTLDSSRQPDQFVATFLFHHFLGPDDLAWLGGLTAEKLSDEESRALVFVREMGAIDNAAYREINQTDTLKASTHLRRLRDLKLLEKKGSGSRTYYEPGEMFVPGPRTGSASAGAESHQAAAQSHQAAAQSHQPEAKSRQVEPNRVTPEYLPPQIAHRLPKAGQRPSQDVLRALIIDLCAAQPLSARNLAALLGRRDHKPLIRDHLSPLIEDGRLHYTIPEMPKHPNQAYAASPPDGGGEP
ncbi:MAG: putative DNA binding domain-containing protein [Phycisphaeraceae bacterium]|nr:putative DNA binding domain-containing protein [Phycisphaeraceae bacterium]MCW5763655.1 putative DNA binding domain-containing protein [Phycisphaeraceae bacterium]